MKCYKCENRIIKDKEELLKLEGTKKPLCDECFLKLKECKVVEDRWKFWGIDFSPR